MTTKRFRVAFSFAGEKREFVSKVAAILAERFGEAAILYDKYHEAEFAQYRLAIDLTDLYRKHTDLNCVVICPKYKKKSWTGLEWTVIHSLLMGRGKKKVMLSRFEYATVNGLHDGAGFVELDNKTPEETATLILQRLARNEDKPRDHYVDRTITDPRHWDRLHGSSIPFDHRSFPRGDVLSHTRMKEFQSRPRVERQKDFLLGLTPMELFRRFKFLESNGNICNGGFLCFGNAPCELIPGATTKCFHWAGVTGDAGTIDDDEFRTGLLEQFEGAMGFLKKTLRLGRTITDEGRTDELEIPIKVLEELVANALVHRDYENSNGSVQVSVYDDRVEIASPGLLPPPLEITKLPEIAVSVPRNPQIARIFYLSGVVERAAKGIKRVHASLEAKGLPPPNFRESDDQCFVVILTRPVPRSAPLYPNAAHERTTENNLSEIVQLHQLPPPKPGFVGREADLDALRDLPAAAAASGAATALLTGLGGMGGIGKSELAKVLAQAWRPHYPDAQLWLDGFGTRVSPPPPSASDLITQVLRAFHPQAGPFPDDLPTLETLLRQTLDGKKALIVLDNAASAAQAAPLHRHLPAGCGFLLTSRHEFLLGTQRPRRVGRLSEAESIKLLREYAPRLVDPAAAALAKYCAGLPLALRLAGAHLAMEGDSADAVAAYLAKVKASRLGALDAEAPDAGEITLQETLRLSVDPLAPADRAVWLRLGVFTGDWDAAAARAVAGDTADEACLTRLRRRNLLESLAREDGAPRHRLHDLAAEYAVKRLAADEGEAARSAAHLAHARHYAAVGDTADELYLAGDPLAALALFDRERIQIEAAFAWLSAPRGGDEGGKADRAAADLVLLDLVNAVVYTGQALRFHPRQRIAWLEAQAATARRVGDHEAEGNALGNLGNAHAALGDVRRAIEYYEQCLVLHREIGDRRGEGADLGNLGLAHADLGDARRAIVYYEQALVISREIGDRRGEGTSLGNLGLAHADLGDARRAIGYYELALVISREIGDRRGEGADLGNLGSAHFLLGDTRRAIEYYEQYLGIAHEIGDRRGEGIALWNSALAQESLGERAGALARAEAALALFEAIEHPNAGRVRKQVEAWRG
jgi:tetratricopeptide (TPR) repeat protein